MKSALNALWLAGQLTGKSAKQIVEFAGDGNIRNSVTSQELRDLLEIVDLEDLERFTNDSIGSSKWQYSGFFLQDIINELGSRLDFSVDFGAYQGTSASPAPDGIWTASDWTFIAEIKTTDAFRVQLDRLAFYRSHVMTTRNSDVTRSSVLLIVARQDTGELEAQIRGSKHAWDMRLIGIDALFKLAYLHRDSVEQESVLTKIRAILRPQEYTRVDGLLDVVFETARAASEEEPLEETIIHTQAKVVEGESPDATASATIQDDFRKRVIHAMELRERQTFRKVRRSLYESSEAIVRFSVAVSKNYGTPHDASYWYAFHPPQQAFIEQSTRGYAVYGCTGLATAVVLPVDFLNAQLPMLSRTMSVDRPPYWHVVISVRDGRYQLGTKREFADVDVTAFVLEVPD